MSKIEWTDRSDWNAIRGCTRASEGCRNCYAEGIAARFSAPDQPWHGFAEMTANGPRWTGKVGLMEDRLTLPLRWRKPCRIFVNSMGDLFHESVPDEWIDRVFAAMALAPQHTFIVLTKRAKRMREYLIDILEDQQDCRIEAIADAAGRMMEDGDNAHDAVVNMTLPLPNVHLGVSCEDQGRADERIPALLETPAAVRFVSAEPLLGPINFRHRLDWIICGGESGPGARPMHVEWARSIREQCAAAGVPFFMKQLGAHVIQDGKRITLRDRKGADMSEWPHDLRVQEFPR